MSDAASLFKRHESAPPGTRLDRATFVAALKFDANGLIPAIAQQFDTREILMMAWMNREALEETLATGRVCYYSRSRGALWRKGESSGQVQHLRALYADCDGDTLIVEVDQTGPACHTGRRSCFYWRLDHNVAEVVAAPLIDPQVLYGREERPEAAAHSPSAPGASVAPHTPNAKRSTHQPE